VNAGSSGRDEPGVPLAGPARLPDLEEYHRAGLDALKAVLAVLTDIAMPSTVGEEAAYFEELVRRVDLIRAVADGLASADVERVNWSIDYLHEKVWP
jgi:hypothetical protein